MNILILIRFFSPDVGGSEFLFCTIAEILAKNGHNVWVITNKLNGVRYIQHKNITTTFISSYNLDVLKKWKQTYKLKFIISAINKGKKIIKQNKIDIIHSNLFEPAIAASVLSTLTSIPHILTIHDVTPIKKELLEQWVKQENNSKLKGYLGIKIFKFIFKLKHAAIHTVSNKTKDDLKNFYKEKPIYVIENSIVIKEETKVRVNQMQFVYVGRLTLHKNLPLVLRVVKRIQSRYPNVKLIIAGDGDYRKHLEKIVSDLKLEDNVIFKGHVTEAEKEKLLASSQALVFPSLFEGFGLVILEAFMQKKPVLVPNVRPLSDIVEDQKTGFILDKDDEEQWTKTIENMIENPEISLKMGNQARQVLEKKYSAESFYKNILNMYQTVLKA